MWVCSSSWGWPAVGHNSVERHHHRFSDCGPQLKASEWLMHAGNNLPSIHHLPTLPCVDDLISAAQDCRQSRNTPLSKKLHLHIHCNGLEALDTLGNYLVPMFVDCGSLHYAHQTFLKLDRPNEHSWNYLVHGYVECDEFEEAFELFAKMQEECIHANMYTCQALLKACGRVKCVGRGKEVHLEIVKEGFEVDDYVGSTLLAMYAKCGFLLEAQDVFDELENRDVVAWTALIAGYAEQDCNKEVLLCLEKMHTEGVCMDSVTLVCSLKGCGSLGAIERGMEIHAAAVVDGLEEDILVGSTLVDMYAKCRHLVEAKDVFDELPERNIVSWNALTDGYSEHGLYEKAVNCMQEMKNDGLSPDLLTFTSGVRSCGCFGAIYKGRIMHAEIVKAGLEREPILGTALMDMYGRCGLLLEAQAMFNMLQTHDVISWTALVTAYVESGLYKEALACYEQMQLLCVPPNASTLSCISKVCGSILILTSGQCVHSEITKKGFEENRVVVSSLIDMYAKFGLLTEACRVFDGLELQDVVMWSSMISGYASQGQSEAVFEMFAKMRCRGIRPGEVACLAFLNVCAHTGLIEKGKFFFKWMIEDYEITPTVEHHNCAADLLGRSGQLDQAAAIVEIMPFQANLATWSAKLTACQRCENIDLALWAVSNSTRLKENICEYVY